jgi:membrane associated rhomboid family serine protease
MRIPPVVKTLLLLNLAAFVVEQFFPLSNYCGLYYVLSPNFHVFQFVTYMFMHGGFSHIFFNMFALWMFGRIMEQVWGGQRFLVYYLVCGLGAGLVQELGQMMGWISPLANTIGASGAVFGILLAFGMTFPNERLFIIPIPFPIKAKYFVALYAVIEVFEAFSLQDGVAHLAHVGGMLFGLILILWWRKHPRHIHMSGDNFWTTTTYEDVTDHYDRGQKKEGWLARWKRERAERKAAQQREQMHVSDGGRVKDYEYNARRRQDNEEIDRILAKIRQHGYAGLTAEEKQRLFDASKK